MANIPFIGNKFKSLAGSSNEETGTMWTTPWEWKTNDGIYVNGHGEAWMYRCLDLFPIGHEDTEARLAAARQLSGIMTEIGRLTPDNKTGVRQLDRKREIHILSITWDQLLASPKENTPELREFQQAAFGFPVPKRILAIGVRLEDSLASKLSQTKEEAERSGDSFIRQMVKQFQTVHDEATGSDVPSLSKFHRDRKSVDSIMRRYRAHIPTIEESDQMEAWYNGGRTPDVLLDAANEYIEILNGAYSKRIEFSVVSAFERTDFTAPNDQWIFDALSTGASAPCLVSIRGELERPSATRARGRKAIRRRQANLDEENESGDISKGELEKDIQRGEALDEYLASETASTLSKCSIVFAREITPATETFMDLLNEYYGIRVKPLPKRQIFALDEVQPGSATRVNPFVQDVNLPMIVYSGLQAFADLGDRKGVYAGLVSPEDAPMYIDPTASSKHNLPPVFCVFGEPGSGKTFFAQNFATQSVLMGHPVIFINPKGGSSLYGMVNFINEFCEGSTASRISMQAAEQEPGAFDPFRFADPSRAHRLAVDHIFAVFGPEYDKRNPRERLEIEDGIRQGAEAGVTCVMDALGYIKDEKVKTEIIELVTLQSRSNSLFALGVATEAKEKINMPAHLTLIDFDRTIGLPDEKKKYSEYSTGESIAVAAVGLIMAAALEILLGHRGGVIILDEAWTFLQQDSSMQFLNRLAREGRSLNVIPVFLTQRIADAINKDMESYISRVLVLQMKDPKEMQEAFRICGLKLTPERRKWVVEASGAATEDIPQGLFRDLFGRHAIITLGPTPGLAIDAWTTNPEEALKREQALLKRAQEEAALVEQYKEAEEAAETDLDRVNAENAARLKREGIGEGFADSNASLAWAEDESVEVVIPEEGQTSEDVMPDDDEFDNSYVGADARRDEAYYGD